VRQYASLQSVRDRGGRISQDVLDDRTKKTVAPVGVEICALGHICGEEKCCRWEGWEIVGSAQLSGGGPKESRVRRPRHTGTTLVCSMGAEDEWVASF
jgi:hypothetical protein